MAASDPSNVGKKKKNKEEEEEKKKKFARQKENFRVKFEVI